MPEINQYHYGSGDNVAGDKIINHFHLQDENADADLKRRIINFTANTVNTEFWTNPNTIFLRWICYLPLYFLYLLLLFTHEILYLIGFFAFPGLGISFMLYVFGSNNGTDEIGLGIWSVGVLLGIVPFWFYIKLVQKIEVALGVSVFFCIKICPDEKLGGDIIWRMAGFLQLIISIFLIYLLFFYHTAFIDKVIFSLREGFIQDASKGNLTMEALEKMRKYGGYIFLIGSIFFKLYILYICYSSINTKRLLMSFPVNAIIDGEADLVYVKQKIEYYIER